MGDDIEDFRKRKMGAPDFRMEVSGSPRGVGRPNSRVVTNKKTGRTYAVHYTPRTTRIEASVIRLAAQEAMGDRPLFTGALELKYVAYVAVPKSASKKKQMEMLAAVALPTKKPDFDNIAKFIDSLKQVVFVDDAQVTDAHIWKRYSDRPRVVIELRKL